MNHAKRMVLVPENTLERLQQRRKVNTAPLTSRLNGLDHQIQEVLKNDELTDEEKVREYSQSLQNYLTYYKQRKAEPLKVKIDSPVQVKPTPASENTEKTEDVTQQAVEDAIERDIITALPKTLKDRGRLLIDKIKENPTVMRWDDKGQLIFEDESLSGSHIGDLVSDILRNRRGFNPIGWETFARGLAKINAPEDLVRNERRQSIVREFKFGKLDGLPKSLPPGEIQGPMRTTTFNRNKKRRQRWYKFDA